MATSHAAEGGARTGTGLEGVAKHTGTSTAVGGGARMCMGTGVDVGMYTSSRGSTETSLTPAASSSAIVLSD